jgi:uncharacterized protein YjbI with pentapeptide repeats
LSGVSMIRVDLTKALMNGVRLGSAELIGCNLSGVNLNGVEMDEANLSGALLVDAELSGSVLSLSDFNGADMGRARLSGAWINLSQLVGAKLSGANLSGSTFFGTDLTGTDLSKAKLNGAILIGADLSGADLRGADLTGARLIMPPPPNATNGLSYENLTGDELRNALNQTPLSRVLVDRQVASLTEVRLKPYLHDTILQGVIYDENTIWPLGFDIPSSAIYQGR